MLVKEEYELWKHQWSRYAVNLWFSYKKMLRISLMAQQPDIRISAIVFKKMVLRILEQNVKTNITKVQTQVQNQKGPKIENRYFEKETKAVSTNLSFFSLLPSIWGLHCEYIAMKATQCFPSSSVGPEAEVQTNVAEQTGRGKILRTQQWKFYKSLPCGIL